VWFSRTFTERDLRLIEVTQDIADSVQKGEVLKIMGVVGSDGASKPSSTSGEAVLCTKDKTFSIKKVETSNSVFMVPPSSSGSFTIESRCGEYYELKQIPGKMGQLAEILEKSLYRGIDETAEELEKLKKEGALLTRSQVMQMVQASEKELEGAFSAHGVVELGGYMRMLSKHALRDVTQSLLNELIEKGWQLDSISEADYVADLSKTEATLAMLALSRLGERKNKNGTDEGEEPSSFVWSLDHAKVAKASAHILFQSHLQDNVVSLKKGWPCEDFMMAWERHTPGAAPTEDLLEGIAVRVKLQGGTGAQEHVFEYKSL